MKTDGARSPDAQLKAMSGQWPDFQGRRLGDGTLVWRGPLRPKARLYEVFLFWKPGAMTLPYVMVIDPPLEPRPGGTFAEIPHLIYDASDPPSSGLCLFDPEGGEWSAARLIAETTIHWTAEWLAYPTVLQSISRAGAPRFPSSLGIRCCRGRGIFLGSSLSVCLRTWGRTRLYVVPRALRSRLPFRPLGRRSHARKDRNRSIP